MNLLTACEVGKSCLCLVEVRCRESKLDLSLKVGEMAGDADEVAGRGFVKGIASGFDLGSSSSFTLNEI